MTDVNGCVFHFSDTLTEPDGIDMTDYTLSHSPDNNFNITCFGWNDGFINPEFDGGAGAYTYDWYEYPAGAISNTTAEDQTGLIAGMYRLRVTDANACHREYFWDLSEPDSVGISVVRSLTTDGAYNIKCNGEDGTIDITVSGGSGPGTYTYNWTVEGNTAWSSNLEDLTIEAGIYHVSVTDANGCTNDRVVPLTEPLPLELSLNVSDITCLTAPAYNDGAIDLTVTGGKAPYGFDWSTDPPGFTSGDQDISGLTARKYIVTVTDDYGCEAVIDTILTLPPQLTVDTLISNYNGFSVSCLGRTDGWLKVIPLTGVAPFSYSWTGPDGFIATTDSIFGLREGTYIVTVTDGHNCEVTEPTTLASPGPLSMVLGYPDKHRGR